VWWGGGVILRTERKTKCSFFCIFAFFLLHFPTAVLTHRLNPERQTYDVRPGVCLCVCTRRISILLTLETTPKEEELNDGNLSSVRFEL